ENGLDSGSAFADLEWLAGYIALTYQEDGEKALGHFLRFRGAVETPISLGRAGYWEGRAHELIGDAEAARLAYLFGAEYQTSFYGLLAAEKAGRPMDPALAAPVPPADLENAGFAQSSVFAAAELMLAAGQLTLAERFLTHLTETLAEDDIARLGAWVIERGEPHLAVMIGKRAARRGIVVPFAYYPLADLGVRDNPVSDELALAIARRESEFDPGVTSHAGAKGLMQVMPATARAVADYLDIRHSDERLISDPAYNARLGTAYLDEMLARFSGNPVMTAAAYNAGPGRPIRWIRDRGDPRRGAIDIVDWIEHIPIDETRNYVMRVTESLPVYRARLTGRVGPLAFTDELIGMPGHARQAVKGEYVRPKARPTDTQDG
ncbi:MAG: lytic transglycosylase domain-containing protein, partial [Pseudomonadota bacterium]